jgi:hypothetical protein
MLLQLAIQFEPAFAFPGEKFAVVAPNNASVSSIIPLSKSGSRWFGIAPEKPIEVLATIGESGAFTDATKRTLPIATDTKYIVGAITAVLLQSGAYGAILNGKRFADLFVFDVAARSSPQRRREFRVDYLYAGPNQITISGEAGGVLKAAATISQTGIDVFYSTLFDVGGKLHILDREFDIPRSKPGTVGKIRYSF